MGVAWHVVSRRPDGVPLGTQKGGAGPGGGVRRGCLVSPGPTWRPRTSGLPPVSVSIRLFLSGFACVFWTIGLPDPTYSTVPIRLYRPGMIVL